MQQHSRERKQHKHRYNNKKFYQKMQRDTHQREPKFGMNLLSAKIRKQTKPHFCFQVVEDSPMRAGSEIAKKILFPALPG